MPALKVFIVMQFYAIARPKLNGSCVFLPRKLQMRTVSTFWWVSLFVLLNSSCKKNTGIVQDIDGNSYPTVAIGGQIWMAENLKVSRYRNGDSIPRLKSDKEWKNSKEGGWCYYENDSANNNAYGKLYNWNAMNDRRGLCPEGWHVPARDEFQKLIDYSGGNAVAGAALKTAALWQMPGEIESRNIGFNAKPGGARYYSGVFYYLGYFAGFWTSTEGNRDFGWSCYLDINSKAVFQFFGKNTGFSCRCIRDSS